MFSLLVFVSEWCLVLFATLPRVRAFPHFSQINHQTLTLSVLHQTHNNRMGTVEYVECEDVAFVQVALRIKKGKRALKRKCAGSRAHTF